MVAEILTVGTELLLGDILNTNSSFIAKELANLGIDVYYQTTVGDNSQRLLDAYKIAHTRSDLIITTGGLGPTGDDLTKEVAAMYFELEMERNEEVYQKIKDFLTNNAYTTTENNYKQADFPVGCTVLPNDHGTAPGCLVEKDNKTIIMLPGPPSELRPMFVSRVMPILSENNQKTFSSTSLRIVGIGESAVEDAITDLISIQTNPTIATYAKNCECEIRVTASAATKKDTQQIMEPTIKELYNRFGRNIYGENDATLESVVVNLLIRKRHTISCSESCTGGLVAAMLVNCAGVSKVLHEGVVSYSNESKINRLGVKPESIEKYGAVSTQVAKEMALGVAESSGTSIGISTTGIAGPEGGCDTKPVGTVCMAISINGVVKTFEKRFKGNRFKIRERAATTILDELRRELLKINLSS